VKLVSSSSREGKALIFRMVLGVDQKEAERLVDAPVEPIIYEEGMSPLLAHFVKKGKR
jgi:hypothetical protein